ncbi:MAG: hypothetical protein K6E50_00050 [Lachnospiraceae bacterium]|nr:hypothetical protein [Lachnospiraceae bacterium]
MDKNKSIGTEQETEQKNEQKSKDQRPKSNGRYFASNATLQKLKELAEYVHDNYSERDKGLPCPEKNFKFTAQFAVNLLRERGFLDENGDVRSDEDREAFCKQKAEAKKEEERKADIFKMLVAGVSEGVYKTVSMQIPEKTKRRLDEVREQYLGASARNFYRTVIELGLDCFENASKE